MARITFSVPEETAKLAVKRAQADRRSLSAYVGMLIERDLRGAGLVFAEATTAEIAGMIEAASQEDPKFRAKVMKLIPAALRGKRAA